MILMKVSRKHLQALGAVVLSGSLLLAGLAAEAADHLDPSARVSAGDADDIADVYAWHTGDATDGNLVLAMTFAGPVPANTFTGDRDVLYGIHIDSADASHDADVDIWVRFAQDSEGNWGYQIEGLPGAGGPVVNRVGATTDLGGAKAFAGVREDPFFFDLMGFRETLMNGDLAFVNSRDFFAGLNVSAIVIEIPLRALAGDGPYEIWGTSSRI
jgi:hypothetical protein